MEYPRIALKVGPKDFNELVDLGNRVLVELTGSSVYLTPTPNLGALATLISDCESAIAAWGPRGNRGSHATYDDLVSKGLALHLGLKELAAYVSNTAGLLAGSDYVTLRALLSSSGFALANSKTPQGTLEAVRDFHNFVSRSLNKNQVKLRWSRPLNCPKGGVSLYEVRRSSTPDFNASVVVCQTKKGSFIDTNDSSSNAIWYYWVVPFNSNGAGVISEMVAVVVLPA